MNKELLLQTKIDEAKAYLVQIKSDMTIVTVDFKDDVEFLKGEINKITYDFRTRKNTKEELEEKSNKLDEINAKLRNYATILRDKKKEYNNELNNIIEKCNTLKDSIGETYIEENKFIQDKEDDAKNQIQKEADEFVNKSFDNLLTQLRDIYKVPNNSNNDNKVDNYVNVFSSAQAEDEYNKKNNIVVPNNVALEPIVKKDDQENKAQHVISKEKVDTTKEKKELKNKWEKIKKVALPIGIAIILVVICKSCSSKNKKHDIPTTTTTTETELDLSLFNEETTDFESINGIDLNNNDSLKEYASYLKNTYSELNDYSLNQIIDAILLANSTKLDDQHIFKNEDEIIDASIDAGHIITKVGSDNIIVKNNEDDIYLTKEEVQNLIDEVNASMNKRKNIGKNYKTISLTVEDFNAAKSELGYDMYKILELCINNYTSENEKAIEYAIIANELITEFTLNFSINENAPLSAYYIMPSIYTTAGKSLANDPKLKFSTIYGNGNNDNLGGDICVEELVEYNTPGNENNIFYNTNESFIKDLLVSSRTRTNN